MNIAKSKHLLSVAALFSLAAGVAPVAAGCSGAEDESVRPSIEVIRRTQSALSAEAITAVNGTYGGECDGRDPGGTDTWTYVFGDGQATTLSVRKNDSDCVLTITAIFAGGEYIATPPISLDTSWKETASAFAEEGEAVAFYGNAMISSNAFSAPPLISLLVSDDPNVSDGGSKSPTFATVSASVGAETVPAPDYTISLANFALEKDVNGVVQSVSGYAQLAEGDVAGQAYAVYEGELTGDATLAEIESAFSGAEAKGLLSELTSLRLPAASFGLLDPAVDLDDGIARTVILRNTAEGVSSYQLIVVTFTP